MLSLHPPTDLEDAAVADEIAAMRDELSQHLRVPNRWKGRLRRTSLARAIRGSNSIEGIHVELDDADAALDDEAPLSADQQTYAEIRGYRQALGYVLAMAKDPDFALDASALRRMHFMMLSHDLRKSPGQYRRSEIYVHDDRTEQIVYTGPPAEDVAGLMDELVESIAAHRHEDPVVQAAMAHLNLVMIHPFRDGNGRMARAVQTLVLAVAGIQEPEFSSIEEWLGANTEDYYRVLAATGDGAWHPENDAHLWVKFNLRAHHLQGQTVRRRWAQAERTYAVLDNELNREGFLPDRAIDALYTALLGFRIRRSTYVTQSGVEERTASRDLKALADLGYLRPVGATRGRYYVAGTNLEPVRTAVGTGEPLRDPYPWLPVRLAGLTAGLPPA